MAGNNHRDVLMEIADRVESAPAETPQHDQMLARRATDWARALVWLPGTRESSHFAERVAALNRRLEPLLASVDFTLAPDESLPEDLQWMHDNVRLVRVTHNEIKQSGDGLRKVPHVRTPESVVTPRVLAIAHDFLLAVDFRYSDHTFSAYAKAFQTVTALNMA